MNKPKRENGNSGNAGNQSVAAKPPEVAVLERLLHKLEARGQSLGRAAVSAVADREDAAARFYRGWRNGISEAAEHVRELLKEIQS